MKRILFSHLIAGLLFIPLTAQPLTQVQPGYAVSLSGNPRNTADAAFLPFIWGTLDSLPRGQRNERFGILYRSAGQNSGTSTIFSFIDAATGASIHDMTIAEYRGSPGPGIRPLPERSLSNDSTQVDAFSIERGAESFTAIRSLTYHRDPSLPLGSSLKLEWSIESPSGMGIRVVLSGIAEGQSIAQGNALRFSPAVGYTTFRPEIAIVGDRGYVSAMTGATQSRPAGVTLTGDIVEVPADQSTIVYQTWVFGTSVSLTEYATAQTANAIAFLNGAAPAPAMITRTLVDRTRPAPGDTLTYRILFHNIGTAPATDIVLTNPIGQGLSYLTGSATGNDATITIGQSNPEPPQTPAVQAITWTFLSNILPGEERWVSFKTIVQ